MGVTNDVRVEIDRKTLALKWPRRTDFPQRE